METRMDFGNHLITITKKSEERKSHMTTYLQERKAVEDGDYLIVPVGAFMWDVYHKNKRIEIGSYTTLDKAIAAKDDYVKNGKPTTFTPPEIRQEITAGADYFSKAVSQ
jgi:hypothetical protein